MEKFYLLFRNYFFWIVLFLFVFIPLYPKFPLISVKGTYVAIRIEDLLIAGSLILWFIGIIPKVGSLLKSTLVQAVLLFWFIGLLSVFSGRVITHTVTLNLGILHWGRRVEILALFLMVATTISSVAQVKLILKVMFITTLLIVLYGFGQIWLHLPVISTTNSEFSKGLILSLTNNSRVNSTFAGQYDLAAYLTIAIVFMGTFYFYFGNPLKKAFITLSGLASFFLLGLTAARASFAAALAGLTIVFWLKGKKVLIIVLACLSIITVGLIPDLRHRLVATVTVNLLGGGGAKYNPPPGTVNQFTRLNTIPASSRAAVIERIKNEATSSSASSKIPVDVAPGEPINTTELGVERSFGIRLNVEWPRAINALKQNPVLGSGYSSIGLATDNDYLRSLGETGVLGTLSFGLIFVIFFKKLTFFLKSAEGFKKTFAVASFASILAILITCFVIDILEASKIAELFWMMLGLCWSLMGNLGYETE